MFEYARDWGMTVRPTVTPAMRSPIAFSELYLEYANATLYSSVVGRFLRVNEIVLV